MNDLSRYNEKVGAILEMEKEWRKNYKHRKPCKDWILHEKTYGYGFCKHYAMARKKHFEREIRALWDISDWDGKIYNWVYISNK